MPTTVATLKAEFGTSLGNGGPRSRNGAEAIVTLDILEPNEDGTERALCFCVDCFSSDGEVGKSERLSRVLSHVSPASPVPSDLLSGLRIGRMEDASDGGMIPWCKEVQSSAAAASSLRAPVIPRQPRKKPPAQSSGAAAEGLKAAAAAAIDKLADDLDLLVWRATESRLLSSFSSSERTRS